MKYTEKQISKMASPISQSEDEKCKNAIRMVRDAMKKLNYTDDGKDIRSYMAESYSYALDLRQQYYLDIQNADSMLFQLRLSIQQQKMF